MGEEARVKSGKLKARQASASSTAQGAPRNSFESSEKLRWVLPPRRRDGRLTNQTGGCGDPPPSLVKTNPAGEGGSVGSSGTSTRSLHGRNLVDATGKNADVGTRKIINRLTAVISKVVADYQATFPTSFYTIYTRDILRRRRGVSITYFSHLDLREIDAEGSFTLGSVNDK
jgi:hypothetical protein